MLNQVMAHLKAFYQDEDGLSATEYAILFVVILAFIVAGAQVLGPRIQQLFNAAAAQIP